MAAIKNKKTVAAVRKTASKTKAKKPIKRTTVKSTAVKAAPARQKNSRVQKQTAAARVFRTTKKKSPRTQKTNNAGEFPLKKEIIIIATLAVSMLMLISCFGGSDSALKWLRGAMFRVFGDMGYTIPFLLFFTVCFVLSNQGDPRVSRKLIGGTICLGACCGVSQLLFPQNDGGGFIGGFIVMMLKPWLGALGTYVIMLCMLAIGIVVITERSVMRLFGLSIKKTFLSLKAGGEKVTRKMQAGGAGQKNRKSRKDSDPAEKNVSPGEALIPIYPQEEPEMTEQPEQWDMPWMDGASFVADREPVRQENYGGPDIMPILKGESMLSEEEPRLRRDSWMPDEVEGRQHEREDITVVPEEVSERDFSKDARITEQSEKTNKTVEKTSARSKKNTEQPGTRTVVTASGKVITVDLDGVPGAKPVKKQLPKKKPENRSKTATYAKPKPYIFPPFEILSVGNSPAGVRRGRDQELRSTAFKLQQTLKNFGVGVAITNISCGPAVTRYELQPEQGVKVSKIVSLTDDIKLNLAASDIRMEAPIPGKAAIGIEVPNKENQTVLLRDLLESREFRRHPSKIAFAAGKNIAGDPVIADIAKMPHLLIAGATGSGKSVCINTLIMSILYKAKPTDVKLIMIDPKVVELSVYNGIPHLMIPVVTDPKKAAGALNWAVAEMADRYQKFAEYNVRDREGYNKKIVSEPTINGQDKPQKLPEIVIIIDELADLMMVAPSDVEDAICRLAQMARAAGIHLVIATQRPSVNVVTGLIKANVPSRIAFSVSSGVDSRTIIDMNGAEKLLGKGDMLFYPSGYQKPDRVQGAFVSDSEVAAVVEFLSRQDDVEGAEHNETLDQTMSGMQALNSSISSDRDEYFIQAGRFVIEKERASIGMLQRMFKIGFNRAARIVDQLAAAGVVGEEEGTKPRKILLTMEEFEAMLQGKTGTD